MESLGEDLENASQGTRAHPLLKPPVARLIRGIPVREVGPWGAGPEDPQDAVEHRTLLPPRAPSAVCAARQLRQEGPNQNPLLVGEVTRMRGSRKGHPGQNGPVAIWLLAPTQNRLPDRRCSLLTLWSAADVDRSRAHRHDLDSAHLRTNPNIRAIC